MATPNDIIRIARSQLGYKEYPAGSNRTKYGKEYGMNGVPWCAEFVWWVFKHAGASELFYGGGKSAYCPSIADYYIAHKQTVSKDKGQSGDIVLFGFGHSSSQHIGFIEAKNSDGSYTCIEGNTSTGNNCNGGMVMRRKRYKSQINWIVRPKYRSIKKIAKPMGKYTLGEAPSTTLEYGSKGTDVKRWQKFLTWYGARKSKNYNGVFGDTTDHATRVFQLTEGLEVDGVVGAKTIARAKTYNAYKPPKKTNAQKINDVAIDLSWKPGTSYKRSGYHYSKWKEWKSWSQLGYARPTLALEEEAEKWFASHWTKGSKNFGYGGRVFACCDKYVGLVIRSALGIKDFPTTLEEFHKEKCFRDNGFDKVKTHGQARNFKAGDVVVQTGHTFLITESGGKLYRAEASLNGFFPRRRRLKNISANNLTVWRVR